jgi:hypothetical protein
MEPAPVKYSLEGDAMRLSRSFAIAASTLALAAGGAFAGDAYHSYEQGGPELLSDAQSPPEEYSMESPAEYSMESPEYSAQAPEYEVYEVYMVPAEIVLIPIEPREGPISGDELG